MKNRQYKMLCHAILKLLEEVGDYLFPHESLYTQTCIEAVPPPLRSEFEEALKKMETNRWILAVRGEFEIKYKITDLGKTVRSEN